MRIQVADQFQIGKPPIRRPHFHQEGIQERIQDEFHDSQVPRRRAAALLAGASLAVLHAQNDNKTIATAHRDILLQADRSWNGKPYTHYPTGRPEFTMIKLTIAPHTALPWHTHPFPNAVYVLSGTLTLHDRDSGKSKLYHQGEAFAESVDDVHRGESGDEPTVLLITYAGTPGVPTSIPARGQKPEY